MQPETCHNDRPRAAGVATNWKQIAIPELPAFKPQLPKRVVLPNGMIVFLTENHELPLISGSAMIRGGSDSEPADKTGLVELYGETWRTGGTEKLSGDQLDDYLEARAAKVETSGSDASTSISFNCLKADFNDVLGIFVDLMRNPAFREDKLALAKKQMNSSISRRNDESDDIASMQTDILGYGKDSAYARVPEYATVAAVTREDLLQWHKQHTTPNNIIFGVVGDFDSKEMEANLRKAFGGWPKGEKVAEPKVTIAPEKPGIYVVDKSDVNQSDIRMIGMGIERRNPDYFALQVMNEIFGGGFSSRLFVNLRTKAGLGLCGRRRRRQRLGSSRTDHIADSNQDRDHDRGNQGTLGAGGPAEKATADRVGNEARKGPNPEFIRLQLRYSREGSARAGDL